MNDRSCEPRRLLIQAELDGELGAAETADLLAHIEHCPECASLRQELAAAATRRRTGLTRHVAPKPLRDAVLAATAPPPARRRSSRLSHASAFGAGLAVAASIAWLFILPSRNAGDLVAAHIRALQPGHLVDVESTDQHTVKPWFDGRLDFSPQVPDLASAGFPLLGGRLDYLDGRPVAALVYGRRKHVIDVFVRPSRNAPSPSPAANGYNVLTWTHGDLQYEAVSDLNPAELSDFVASMRQY